MLKVTPLCCFRKTWVQKQSWCGKWNNMTWFWYAVCQTLAGTKMPRGGSMSCSIFLLDPKQKEMSSAATYFSWAWRPSLTDWILSAWSPWNCDADVWIKLFKLIYTKTWWIHSRRPKRRLRWDQFSLGLMLSCLLWSQRVKKKKKRKENYK